MPNEQDPNMPGNTPSTTDTQEPKDPDMPGGQDPDDPKPTIEQPQETTDNWSMGDFALVGVVVLLAVLFIKRKR